MSRKRKRPCLRPAAFVQDNKEPFGRPPGSPEKFKEVIFPVAGGPAARRRCKFRGGRCRLCSQRPAGRRDQQLSLPVQRSLPPDIKGANALMRRHLSSHQTMQTKASVEG